MIDLAKSRPDLQEAAKSLRRAVKQDLQWIYRAIAEAKLENSDAKNDQR
ncbi:hypothetical protein [Bradyrhizobium ottawaense]